MKSPCKNHSLREGKIIPQIMFSKILRRSNYIYHVNTIRISQTRKTVQTWLLFINLLRSFNTGTNLPRFVTNQLDIAFLCVFLSKFFRKIDTMPLYKLYFVLRIIGARCKPDKIFWHGHVDCWTGREVQFNWEGRVAAELVRRSTAEAGFPG